MAGEAAERLSWKEPLHSLQVELQQDFGLSIVESKALIRRLEEFIDTYFGVSDGPRTTGQICYTAVALGERAGKPIRYCLMVPVHLTLLHEADASVLAGDGSPALRSVRLERLCSEAFEQGAALSQEDLALLLGVEKSTVRRIIKACTDTGFRPPTRGLVQDIGPTVSHKAQVLRLYFAGHLPERIAGRTGHSLGSVERYLRDFARVVHLFAQSVDPAAIARITSLSPSLVGTYLTLYEDHDRPGNRYVLDRLLSRFGPVDQEGS